MKQRDPLLHMHFGIYEVHVQQRVTLFHCHAQPLAYS